MSEYSAPDTGDAQLDTTVSADADERWRNLQSFLEGVSLSDLERLIVERSGDPTTAWQELDRYWSTGDSELLGDYDFN